MKVTIDRNQWLRGKRRIPDNATKCYANSLWSKRFNGGCCLGHALIQVCQIPVIEIKGIGSPAAVVHDGYSNWSIFGIEDEELVVQNTEFTKKAIDINDSPITDEQREFELQTLFAEQGIES